MLIRHEQFLLRWLAVEFANRIKKRMAGQKKPTGTFFINQPLFTF